MSRVENLYPVRQDIELDQIKNEDQGFESIDDTWRWIKSVDRSTNSPSREVQVYGRALNVEYQDGENILICTVGNTTSETLNVSIPDHFGFYTFYLVLIPNGRDVVVNLNGRELEKSFNRTVYKFTTFDNGKNFSCAGIWKDMYVIDYGELDYNMFTGVSFNIGDLEENMKYYSNPGDERLHKLSK